MGWVLVIWLRGMRVSSHKLWVWDSVVDDGELMWSWDGVGIMSAILDFTDL